MDYKKIHDSIIQKAIEENRKRGDGIYYESHHIIPRSLGGTEDKNNKVLLTAREHFIVHKCLPLIYLKEDNINAYHKMNHALHRFLYSKNSNNYKISSREYERIKQQHSKSISESLKGIERTEEFGKNVSEGLKKYYETNKHPWEGRQHSEETLEKMSKKQSGKNNPMYGRERTEEERKKISNTMKGHKKSPETIEKFKKRKWSDEKKKQISESVRLAHARRKAQQMG